MIENMEKVHYIGKLLDIVHDTGGLPEMKHIQTWAMNELREINVELEVSKTKPNAPGINDLGKAIPSEPDDALGLTDPVPVEVIERRV